MSSVIDNFTAYLPSIDRSSVKNLWTFNTSGSHKLLSNLTPLHFCLNHPQIAPDYMHRMTAVIIWQLWCHAARKHHFLSLHTTYVLTQIQTTCTMLLLKGTLWSGNGVRTRYCGLTSVLLSRSKITLNSVAETHVLPPRHGPFQVEY